MVQIIGEASEKGARCAWTMSDGREGGANPFNRKERWIRKTMKCSKGIKKFANRHSREQRLGGGLRGGACPRLAGSEGAPRHVLKGCQSVRRTGPGAAPPPHPTPQDKVRKGKGGPLTPDPPPHLPPSPPPSHTPQPCRPVAPKRTQTTKQNLTSWQACLFPHKKTCPPPS